MNLFQRSTPVFTGALVALVGLILFGGGIWLVMLHGSPYYCLAGLALLITGVGLIRGARWALWVYGLAWLGTLVGR